MAPRPGIMVTMMNERELAVETALDEARYRYKLVEWDNYFYFMQQQDVYYDVADRVQSFMTEGEVARYEWGEFPKWLTDAFDAYEMKHFGTKASDHL